LSIEGYNHGHAFFPFFSFFSPRVIWTKVIARNFVRSARGILAIVPPLFFFPFMKVIYDGENAGLLLRAQRTWYSRLFPPFPPFPGAWPETRKINGVSCEGRFFLGGCARQDFFFPPLSFFIPAVQEVWGTGF